MIRIKRIKLIDNFLFKKRLKMENEKTGGVMHDP